MKEKMKNTIRRVLSVFAAIAMVLGIVSANVTPVMAEGNGGKYTITVKNANPHQTYTLYKIFDATSNSTRQGAVDENENSELMTNGISYTLPSNRSLNTEYNYTDSNNVSHSVKGSTWFHVDEGGNVIKLNDDITTTQISTEDFKQWAMQFSAPAVTTKTNSSESAQDLVFSDLTDGYYFITTTTGSLVTVTSVAPNQTVKDKNGTPAVTKSEDESTNDIGKTVKYTVRINLVPGTKNVVFHDQLTAGLTLNGNAPTKLEVSGEPLDSSNYSLQWKNEAVNGKDDITITFLQNYLDNLKESTQVDLEYSATVNSAAVVNAHNDAFLKYGENNNIESTHIIVYESTFGFQVNKVDDSSTPKALSGAKFVLSRESNLGNLTENLTAEQQSHLIKFDSSGRLTTAENGTYIQEGKGENSNSFAFGGLDADKDGTTYYLYEVKAPDGYNKLTGPVEVKITPTFDAEEITKVNNFKVSYKLPGSDNFIDVNETNNEVVHEFNISNNQGILLPSTGGIGTTIFYVIGGVVVAGAIVLLIARRKKNA